MTTDFKTMLKQAQLLRHRVPICLRGDLVSRIEELDQKIQAAGESAALVADGLEDTSPTLEMARELQALREEMIEQSYPFIIQALPVAEYRALKLQHPPREAESEDGEAPAIDQRLDANGDTFLEPLLRACCIDPVLDDETWAELEGKLSERQFTELAGAAVYVNKGMIDIPFSLAASKLLQKSANE